MKTKTKKSHVSKIKQLCAELDRVKRQAATMQEAAEMLWVVLANVSGGDWLKQSDVWQEAAARWRDNYFKARADNADPNLLMREQLL